MLILVWLGGSYLLGRYTERIRADLASNIVGFLCSRVVCSPSLVVWHW